MLHQLFLVLGGPICYASCLAVIGVGGIFMGAAALPLLGFTSTGITAGSWAAAWMASFGGVVPAGSLFASLQSAGAAGISWSAIGSVYTVCTQLCDVLP